MGFFSQKDKSSSVQSNNAGIQQEIESQVKALLKSTVEPDFKKDLWSLGWIKNLAVELGAAQKQVKVSFEIQFPTPASPYIKILPESLEKAIRNLDAVKQIAVDHAVDTNIQVTSNVKSANRHLSHQGGERKTGVSRIEGVAHVIAVSSGKGGVGKSTVSVALATALAQTGARVGLMDADVYGPNIPLMMGISEKPKLIQKNNTEYFVPPSRYGVKVMSMGFLVDPDQPIVWRGPMLHSLIQQFCHQVEWGELDYLIVDMPPGTGDVQLSLAQMVPITGSVLVTTPQEVAIQDVKKAFHMFEKVRVPLIGFVENMSYFVAPDTGKSYAIFGEGGGDRLAKKYDSELLAKIPLVPEIRIGGDLGQPIVVSKPEHPVAQSHRALASRVAQKIALMSEEAVDPNSLIQIESFN